jgi:Meckel syndrome type 1 protein
MTTDFNGREPDITTNGADAPLFAAQPVWERNRKRSAFGGRKPAAKIVEPTPSVVSPEPRSFAREEPAMMLDDPMDRPISDRTATVTNTTLAAAPLAADEPLAAPIGRPVRTTRAKASSGASPALIAGGVAALLVIGAGGWYLARPHDGVPELAPGQPTTSEVATAPVTPEPGGVETATNTLPQRTAAAKPAAPRAERQVAQQTRVRPAARAAAPSAEASSSNASAVLPDGPQPYSSINPAAPTQVTPPAPPPVQATPQSPPVQAPEPAQTAPAAPAPTETPPTPPSA